MSSEDKLREFNDLMDAAVEFLESLPPEERRRRWQIWVESDERFEKDFAAHPEVRPRCCAIATISFKSAA